MRILVVEDEQRLAARIAEGLRDQGMAVDVSHDGTDALDKAELNTYDVLVLDRDLPGTPGDEVCRQLSARAAAPMILMLTALSGTDDRVDGLSLGADDYLGKPFDLTELIARCRALLRRAQGRSVEHIRYQDLTVNPAAQTVEVGTTRVPLTSREWAILLQLLTNQGIPQSRSRLEESLYGWQEEIESNAIEVHVSNLRKKLGSKLIKTVRNIGYVVEKE